MQKMQEKSDMQYNTIMATLNKMQLKNHDTTSEVKSPQSKRRLKHRMSNDDHPLRPDNFGPISIPFAPLG